MFMSVLSLLYFFMGMGEVNAQSPLVKTASYYEKSIFSRMTGRTYKEEYNLRLDGNGTLTKTTTYEDDWVLDYGYRSTEETWRWRVKGNKKWADYTFKYIGWMKGRIPLPDVSKTIANDSQPALFNLAGNSYYMDENGDVIRSVRASLTYHYSGDIKPVDNVFYGVQQYLYGDNTDQSVDMFKEFVSVSGTGDIVLPAEIYGLYDVVNYYRLYVDIQ